MEQFSEALVTQRTSQQQSRRRRNSTASQGSVDDEFAGIENIATLWKLHRLCVWLRKSSIHATQWDDAVGLRLGIDNKTRWSSWFLVIDRVLRKQDKIKLFMIDHTNDLGDISFNSDDWDILEKARNLLEPFASATLYAEGDTADLSQGLVIMDALLQHYEKQKVCSVS